MKLTKAVELLRAETHYLVNDDKEKAKKVLIKIEPDFGWENRMYLCELYAYYNFEDNLIVCPDSLWEEMKYMQPIKASEIELEEEPLYTREDYEEILLEWHDSIYQRVEEGIYGQIMDFINHKFNTVELTEEELKAYYENKEGKKIIIKPKYQ